MADHGLAGYCAERLVLWKLLQESMQRIREGGSQGGEASQEKARQEVSQSHARARHAMLVSRGGLGVREDRWHNFGSACRVDLKLSLRLICAGHDVGCRPHPQGEAAGGRAQGEARQRGTRARGGDVRAPAGTIGADLSGWRWPRAARPCVRWPTKWPRVARRCVRWPSKPRGPSPEPELASRGCIAESAGACRLVTARTGGRAGEVC
jgi:hypothetical protein